MKNELPLKPIKRLIKEYYSSEVSNETVKYVQSVMQDALVHFIEAGVVEFNQYNQIRKLQGLPELKRLCPYVFTLCKDRIFKVGDELELGESISFQAYPNGDTTKQENSIIIENAIEVV